MQTTHRILRWLPWFGLATAVAFAAPAPRSAAGVAVVHDAPWTFGEPARDGAGEFAVFLNVARLQREHRAAGLVAVGDRHGMLRSGGERALRQVALAGVAVVKLASRGEVAASDLDVFLSGGSLSAETAARVLSTCLQRYGAPPAAADPAKPNNQELARIRQHLERFQQELALAGATAIAAQ